jgi:hypothetical protein
MTRGKGLGHSLSIGCMTLASFFGAMLWARMIVCQAADMVGPPIEAGRSTLAKRPQSRLEETIHS